MARNRVFVWKNGLQRQIISRKSQFSKIYELYTYGTRPKSFPIQFEGCDCATKPAVVKILNSPPIFICKTLSMFRTILQTNVLKL